MTSGRSFEDNEYQEMTARHRKHASSKPGDEPLLLFARALDFAARKHVHQRRKGESAEPYINHLAEVARLLAAATEGRQRRRDRGRPAARYPGGYGDQL